MVRKSSRKGEQESKWKNQAKGRARTNEPDQIKLERFREAGEGMLNDERRC